LNIPVLRRQVQTVLVIGLVMLSASAILELASVARTATERAVTECSLVAGSVARQLGFLVEDEPDASLARLGRSPRLQQVLDEAIARAPSVLQVAVCDPGGDVVTRSPRAIRSRARDAHPSFPDVHNLAQAVALLWDLRDADRIYQVPTPVSLGDQPFAIIRIDVAATFLRDSVRSTYSKGVVGSLLFVSLVLMGGFALSVMALARLRTLEAGVSAMRAGRFDQEIPESGADEFNRLARELNLLGRQIRAERERMGAGRTLHQAADLLGEGILTLGPQREIQLVNAAASTWLGIDRTVSHGRRLDDLLPAGHPLLELARRLPVGEERMRSVEIESVDGRETLVAVGHRVEDPEGPSPGLLIEIETTPKHAALHSLIDQSRVLSRMGEMAAGVAHELRGPLQSLSFEISALSAAAARDPAAIEEHVRNASEKIQRLDRAIGGFLRIARIRPPVVERLHVNELVAGIRDDATPDANLAGMELDFEPSLELPEVMGDRETLRQAIDNLLRNAVQAQPSRDGKIVLRTRIEAGWVCISVVDSGPGIPLADLEKVFGLFFTTREDGSGVGLPVVRQTVELHGGEVGIASHPGLGTQVTIRLPPAPRERGTGATPKMRNEGTHAP
jgi:signal transduction histidine kinase